MYNYRKKIYGKDFCEEFKGIKLKPGSLDYQTYVTLRSYTSGIFTYDYEEHTSNFDSMNLDGIDSMALSCIPYFGMKSLNKFSVSDSVVVRKQSIRLTASITATIKNEELVGIVIKKTNIKFGKIYYSAYEVLTGNTKSLLLEDLLEPSVT